MILNRFITNSMVTHIDAAKTRHRRGCDLVFFDWGKAIYQANKFKGVIRCHKEADRIFILRVLAASQSTIPPWAVWDALEAVKAIHPRIPLAYFRTVLRDNCRKSGVDLDKALRGVRVPADLPRHRTTKRRTTPLPDESLRLRTDELLQVIP